MTAAKSFVGRYVNVQAFVHFRWTTVKRVFLTKRTLGSSPTVSSNASFRLQVRHGLKLRGFLTLSQAGSSYTSSTSNIGATAARSLSSASICSNTRSCEPVACPSTCSNAPSGRRASANGW